MKQEKQSKFEYLIQNIEVVEELIKRGLMPITILRDIDIYRGFQRMEKFSYQGRYAVLSHDFHLSEKRIEQIIQNLSR